MADRTRLRGWPSNNGFDGRRARHQARRCRVGDGRDHGLVHEPPQVQAVAQRLDGRAVICLPDWQESSATFSASRGFQRLSKLLLMTGVCHGTTAFVGRATVGRCQAKVRRRLTHPAQLDPSWGGRRRAVMNVEEEREFLDSWAESAADGGLLIVAPLRAALAQQLGRPVTHSVVYRLLARHGWRKVAPDTRHPDPRCATATNASSSMSTEQLARCRGNSTG